MDFTLFMCRQMYYSYERQQDKFSMSTSHSSLKNYLIPKMHTNYNTNHYLALYKIHLICKRYIKVKL